MFNISSLLSGGDYANPLNRTADAPEKLFKAYPYIFASLGYVSGEYFMIRTMAVS